jgi:threonine dehydratase
VIEETGAVFIPPYDDDRIIAGQGTAAVELFEEEGDLDQVWMPVGGGGLAAGSAVVAAAGGVHVIAGEPVNADDAYRSMARGRIEPVAPTVTLADGLRTGLGERNFEILKRHGVEVALASEAGIKQAMRLIWERLKVVVEPSSAVPLAAMLENPGKARGRVGVILTGGNVDLDGFFDAMGGAT